MQKFIPRGVLLWLEIITVGTSSATLSGFFYTWDLNQGVTWRYNYPRPASELNTGFSLHVFKQPDASLNEMSKNNFTIFQNPSSESIKISFPMSAQNIEKITFTDALGRTVLNQRYKNTSSDNIEVYVNQLGKGIYYVSILTEDGKISTQPFIKN
jgi:hypothetical protein